ncbi:ATP-binding protein [Aquamicrobium ahrensii]|uniref:DNA-binding winged helix-turn-helix (WHTH) protein/predicted ATPase n=1 Tax=Aquamicrobium ahrensii TaxID=469551 RepID=A0ABV2KQD9_9HYPH
MDSISGVHTGALGESEVLSFPPFRLDPADKRLWRGERPIPLKPKSFQVLHHLLTHAGRLVTKRALLDAVWHDVHVGDANIKTAIKEIRRALGDSTETPRFVATVHRYGYRFIFPVGVEAQAATDLASCDLHPPYASATASGHEVFSPSRLVARAAELSSLGDMLAKARTGERQLVLVTGPPGIGKSVLLHTFLGASADRRDLWLARGQCLPHIGRTEPYLPLLDALSLLCRERDGATVQSVLARYAPAWLAQMPALLSDAEAEGLQRRTFRMGPERMLRQMADAVEALSVERPVVLCLDDLQWCDGATLELIDTLTRRRAPKARLLIIGAYRTTEMADARHPLLVLKREMQVRGLCEELSLEPLSKAAVAAYCASRFGADNVLCSLPGLVYEQSGGHPLFMTAIIDDLVRRGEIVHRDGRWSLAASIQKPALPASVREFVAGEFEQLDARARQLLEVASVLGPEFSMAELAAVLAPEAEAQDLEALALAMARRQIFLAPASYAGKLPGAAGARFAFRHDLYREVVYAGLTLGRRSALHRSIGEWREQVLGERAAEIASTLAVHFEACEDWFRAARYHRLAGEQAQHRHAPRVAAEHARCGITLIQSAASNQDMIREELLLQQLLAVALITSDGFAAAELSDVYARADELCREIDDLDSAIVVQCGFWNLALNRGDGGRVREVCNQLLARAESHPEPVALLQAQNVAAQTELFAGEFGAAEFHLERCLSLYNTEAHRHLVDTYDESPGVVIRLAAGWMRWAQGRADEARRHIEAALGLSRASDHPFAVEQGLWGAAVVHQHCGDVGRVHDHVEELIWLCRKTGASLWLGGARILRGWTLVQSGRRGAGITALRRGIDQWRATGTMWLMPYYLCLMADALSRERMWEEASALLEEAQAIAKNTGERWYDAELCRLAGELARRRGESQTAETWFLQGLDISRRQGASSWELRAAASLASLWRAQGRASQAHGLLADVYSGFVEGMDTADLKNARALLDTWG